MEWYENRILSAKNGTNPMLMKEMKGGYAVFGDTQFLPGYCVLLPKKEVHSLNDLPIDERNQFLSDMAFLGDALIASCRPLRINYDILGNTDNYLHAHVFPRYEWEQEERRKMPVWLYDKSNWYDKAKQFDIEKHSELRKRITSYLELND
ncbi:HIT domain-containing protein [uncultured Enterococcus sp.]|uniref:HIT family protein n=1 Tax=uncultured Enterococcus sp. TaxID=167972 RepID=UPI002AA789BB|nr:HIT domain-containing protein [uncultured Enterococcus sp.]